MSEEECTESSYERRSGSVRVASAWQRLVHLLLPCSCLACRRPVWRAADSLGLCDGCRELLEPGSEDGEPAPAVRGPWLRLAWAFDYRPPLDEVMQAFKFRRLDYLGSQLARAAASAARRSVGTARGFGVEAVVPVPLHWRRRWRRGYDQARLLADGLACELDLPVRRWLRRRRATPAQSLLDRDVRRRNLRRAFVVSRSVRRGARILLVDDVVTTGSTLEAAAGCLRDAGVVVAVAFAVARTPDDGEIGGVVADPSANKPHLL